MFRYVMGIIGAGALMTPSLAMQAGSPSAAKPEGASIIPAAKQNRSSDNLSATAPPTLTREELIAIAAPVRTFRPATTFDAAPRRDLTGRRFSYELPIRPGGAGGCISMPWWRYSADRRKLELVFFGELRTTGSMRDYRGKIHPVLQDTGQSLAAPVKCEEGRTGSYRASNLLGASTTIAKVIKSVIEIGTVHDALEENPTNFVMETVDMDPVDAKAIIPRLRARIEGELGHWANGSSVACGIDHPHADMTTIWDTVTDACIYQGFISRVSFVDGPTGRVLAESTFKRPIADYLGLAQQ